MTKPSPAGPIQACRWLVVWLATIVLVAGCFGTGAEGSDDAPVRLRGADAISACADPPKLDVDRNDSPRAIAQAVVFTLTCIDDGGAYRPAHRVLGSEDLSTSTQRLVSLLEDLGFSPAITTADASDWFPDCDTCVLLPGLDRASLENLTAPVVHFRIGPSQGPADYLFFASFEAPTASTDRLVPVEAISPSQAAVLSASPAAALVAAALRAEANLPAGIAIDVAFTGGDLGGYEGFGPLALDALLREQEALPEQDRYRVVIQVQSAGQCAFQPATRPMLQREPASAVLYDAVFDLAAQAGVPWAPTDAKSSNAIKGNRVKIDNFSQPRAGQVYAAELWVAEGYPAIAIDSYWWANHSNGARLPAGHSWPIGTVDDTYREVCWDGLLDVAHVLATLMVNAESLPAEKVTECGRKYPTGCS